MARYKFLPYATNSKVDCPSCGEKKCFTLYIDTESGEVMPNEYGRCDRVNSCQYFKYPNFGESKVFQATPIVRAPQKFIDKSVVEGCMIWYDKNPFTEAVIRKFGEKGEQTLREYFVGTTKTLGTTFWTVNSDGVTHSGKVITYIGQDSGEKLAPYRDKEKLPYYPYKKEDGYYSCFFGQHLVKKDSSLWIVESEKTAILCRICWPEHTWISGGGATGVTSDKIKILRESGYEGVINIMPDCDKAGREATGKMVSNLDVYGYRAIVHDLGEEYQNGEDWGDLILKGINN